MAKLHHLLTLSFILGCVASPAAAQTNTTAPMYTSLTVGGTLAFDLTQAYRVLPDSTGYLEAPLILRQFSIQILPRDNETLVTFFPEQDGTLTNVTLTGGTVISRDTFWPAQDVRPIVLPGAVAGEIIAAYGEAQKREDSVVLEGPKTFEVGVELMAGGSTIAFVPRSVPKSLMGKKCIAGNCNGRTVYNVRLRDNHVVIRYEAIL